MGGKLLWFILLFLCIIFVHSKIVRYREYTKLETQMEIAEEISRMYEKMVYPKTMSEKQEYGLAMSSFLADMMEQTLFEDNWTIPPPEIRGEGEFEVQRSCQKRSGVSTITPFRTKFDVYEKYMSDVSLALKSMMIDIHHDHHDAILHRNISYDELRNSSVKRLKRMKNYLRKINVDVQIVMADAQKISAEIINCDPEKLERNVNFIELERVFQRMVTPKHTPGGSCWDFCEDMHGPTRGETYHYGNLSTTCEGTLRNCENALNAITCHSETKSRRYASFGLFNPQIWSHDAQTIKKSLVNDAYGDIENCPTEKIDLWDPEVGLFAGGVCGMCLCTCEENAHYAKHSTFIISSQLAEADTEKNMAVTGVRFVKKDRIIYTQIRQGEMMPGGRIKHDTEMWKPIKPLNYLDVMMRMGKTNKPKMHSPKKFIVISSEINSVNLDNVSCSNAEEVIIGIGLRLSQLPEYKNHIVPVIKCLPVGFIRGQYYLDDMDLIKPIEPSTKEKTFRTELEIGDLPPDKVDQFHTPDSKNGQYVKFQMSGKKDAGQSVIPWFDAQNVSTTRSFPLSAVGLYHRGAPQSGGFLAYRLFPIPYEYFLENSI